MGIPLTKAVVALTVISLLSGLGMSMAQEPVPVPKLKASACENIQKQVNEIVELSQSTTISDAEKVELLSKSWAQSMAAMQDKAKNDDEMAKLIAELGKAMGQVLALALVPSAEGGKAVSPDAANALNDVKKQIKPYVGFMKMLCPDLILPPEISK
jgi:hypothetical protein